MKIQLIKWTAVLFAALLFAGCSSMKKSDDGATEGAPVSDSGAQTSGASEAGKWTGNPLDNPDSPLYQKVIYFDFDRSEIRSEFVDTLRAHAEYLVANPNASLTVEGHCDERGSREYNVGLGERRALSVRSFLEAEGVAPGQINIISYGEERPADPGHNEAAWAMNRRAVLVY